MKLKGNQARLNCAGWSLSRDITSSPTTVAVATWSASLVAPSSRAQPAVAGGLAWSRGSTTANIMFEAPRDIDSQTPQSFMLDIKYISKFLSRREAFLPVWLALCISKGKPYRPPFFCYTCCITSSPAKLRTEAFLVASKLQIGMSGKMKTYRVVIPQEKRGAPSIKHFCQLLGKLSSRFSLRRRNL